jgi:hypothetical protein
MSGKVKYGLGIPEFKNPIQSTKEFKDWWSGSSGRVPA